MTIMSNKTIISSNKTGLIYGKKRALKLREEVNRLHFETGMSKIQIARKKHVSNNFVLKWTKSQNQDFTEDKRGWPLGKRRKWDDRTIEIVKEIHTSLANDPKVYFTGATAVSNEWRKRYPDIEIPPLRTLGMILSDLGLTSKNRKRNKGAARYLHYPEYTIQHLLGGRVLEADFIQRHIFNRTEPIHFVGFSFKQPPKIREYKRITAQTNKELTAACANFFKTFEKPNFIKVDNASAMIGTVNPDGLRSLSTFILHMLKSDVCPIFSVPRKPFSQASIEGNNSVFSRFFWNRTEFKNIEEIDEQLEWFNESSRDYLGYTRPSDKRKKKEFIPKVFFIRQVRDLEDSEDGFIDVLHENISLPQDYINLFVLAEWNLKEEKLYMRYEREKRSEIILEKEFKINAKSKKKLFK